MKGLADIAEVFGIFHDGMIIAPSEARDESEIAVWILYLAERVSPGGEFFRVCFDGLEKVTFVPWEEEGKPVLSEIRGFASIFRLEPEILSAEVVDDQVKVACSCLSVECCGGSLAIVASGCRVFDESGREWGLEELRKLADDYWEEWSSRGREDGGGEM